MFVVVHVEAVPSHIRGYLSRFLVEAAFGLYVGTVSPKVADGIWTRLEDALGAGRCAMIRSDQTSEAGYRLQLSGHEPAGRVRGRTVVDMDGLQLVSEAVAGVDMWETAVSREENS